MDYPGSTLDLLTVSQAGKEETVNSLFSAFSPAVAFGRRASTSSGLVWGYYGGVIPVAGVPTTIANGTLTLDDNTTCYVRVNITSGVVDFITVTESGWPEPWSDSDGDYVALYEITTASGAATAWTDYRTSKGDPGLTGATGAQGPAGADGLGVPAGGATGEVLAKASNADNDTEWVAQSGGDLVRLAQVVTAASATTITFSGISGAYSALKILFKGRDVGASASYEIRMQFNGDTTAGNYSAGQYFQGSGGSAIAGTVAASSTGVVIGIINGTSVANSISQVEIMIVGYADGFYKVAGGSSRTSGGLAAIDFREMVWKSTSAITSIVLTTAGTNFVDGTTATLYGMT